MSQDQLKKKQYGLVLKKKAEPVITQTRPVASVFNDDDDEEDKVDVSGRLQSASTIRVQNAAERMHERAKAEDPNIFDYDASYDEIQSIKNEKIAEQKKQDKDRQSKYALEIIKSHKRREIEKQSREERQQQKERINEGDEFADKEVFVTGAYREQMEAVQKFREEEVYEARFNSLTAVEKQKAWQAGFGRQMLEDLSRSGVKKEEKAEEKKEGEVEKKKKERHVRKRLESRSPSPTPSNSNEKAKEKPKEKKSIYSDDDEDEDNKFKPPQKNFDSELKPGLNRVIKKAQTKAEKLQERLFTPTPPSSDDERDDKKDNGRRERVYSRKSTDEEPKKQEQVEEKQEQPKKLIKPIVRPKIDKEARLNRLKDILKQRNGPEQIEEFRKRYLERKASNFLVVPL